MRPTLRGARRLRRALARDGRARVTFRIAARDAAKNRAVTRLRVTLRR
jgi:hypothetical protein